VFIGDSSRAGRRALTPQSGLVGVMGHGVLEQRAELRDRAEALALHALVRRLEALFVEARVGRPRVVGEIATVAPAAPTVKAPVKPQPSAPKSGSVAA
jgi:hypothetical protein